MSKIEVNNEIVLMRQQVRQVRLYIVRKLIKQIKILGSKKGDDKQREKYKRKADKLGVELLAIKKLKDDEISKYSITNERTLKQILSGEKLEPETCALARISNHKIMKNRVAEFKQKFPNYEEHLGPGRRKLIKMKRKAGKQAKKNSKITGQASDLEEKETEELESEINDDNDSEASGEESEDSLPKIEENKEPELQEKISNIKRKAESSSSESEKIKTRPKILPEIKPRAIKLRKTKEKEDKIVGITPVDKEAVVKSFSRFLEGKVKEDNDDEGLASNELEIKKSGIELEKEEDPFFMTEDGREKYLSVVVPKSNLTENEEEGIKIGIEDHDSFRSRNNRFFDKVDNKKIDKRNDSKNFRDNNSFAKVNRFKTDKNESRDVNNTRNNNRGKVDSQSMDKSFNKNSIEMHPSWAAKKKQQEILKLGFQGKKIVFDDLS